MFVNPAYARFTRWDCSDWSPFPTVVAAEDELASSILETLASNRGKTLYCGVDQSDTWTKRQVYDNAHRHNDRDRTQYDGSQRQGRFRGFTAGQEGWLTDGEHGITGVSPERIFEFPEVERKRRKRYRTFKPCPAYDEAQQHPPYSPCVVQTGLHSTAGAANANRALATNDARAQWLTPAGRPEALNTNPKYQAWLQVSARQGEANAAARAVCRADGARLTGSARIPRSSIDSNQVATTFYYSENLGSGGNYHYRVGLQIHFDATCRKRR